MAASSDTSLTILQLLPTIKGKVARGGGAGLGDPPNRFYSVCTGIAPLGPSKRRRSDSGLLSSSPLPDAVKWNEGEFFCPEQPAAGCRIRPQ
jgi:hypothetical protein